MSQYLALMDTLTTTCGVDKQKLADMTVQSVKLVNEKGKQINNLSMMTRLSQTVQGRTGLDCAEQYAQIVLSH